MYDDMDYNIYRYTDFYMYHMTNNHTWCTPTHILQVSTIHTHARTHTRTHAHTHTRTYTLVSSY